MIRFIGRWLADAIGLALPLACAVVAMQLPAITSDYAAALLQISNDARRDIDQREDAARSYYHLPAGTDDELRQALQDKEPANAAALARSLDRQRDLRGAYEHLEATSPLLRPPVALLDAVDDPSGDRTRVLRTAIGSHVTQIALSSAAAIYGLIGLAAGALLAEIVISILRLRPRAYLAP